MRLVLAAAVALCSSCSAQSYRAAPPQFGDPLTQFATVKVSEHVYAFVSPETKVPLVSGNVTAILGADGVAVVDSGHFPSVTRRIIEEIRKLTSKPVKYLVITHWHGDHAGGNYVFQEAWPGLQIISTAETRERMVHMPAKYDDLTQIQQVLPALKKQLDEDAAQPKLPAEDREYFRSLIAVGERAIPEFQRSDYLRRYPNQAFCDSLDLYLGDRVVQVRFLGRGNTSGDALVYVPDEQVLVTGDLLVNPIPYAFGAFPAEWGKVMDRMRALDAKAIVPGHGPVETDWGYFDEVRRLLKTVTETVASEAKAGKPLKEIQAAIDLKEFETAMAGDDPTRRRMFRSSIRTSAVRRAYREITEAPLADEE